MARFRILLANRGAENAAVAAAIAIALMCLNSTARAADVSAAVAGARYGQAVAAAKICPAGTVTDKAKALKGTYPVSDAAVFDTEAAKVVDGWDKAFACTDRDPNTGRTTSCRKMKLTNCRQAWLEIGPEGKDLPGLLDLNFDNWKSEE